MVAIITDFGNQDPYVGIMKGVMLSIDPDLRFIDITNEIEPQNIVSASFVLYSAWDYLPENTVFLVVVDPGVGSDRLELIGKSGDRIIVCPDNGLPSMLIRMGISLDFYRADANLKVELAGSEQWSNTFHGRDLFAPIAGRAAAGKFFRITGATADPVLLQDVGCSSSIVYSMKDGNRIAKLQGHVIHVDGFGNCITSIHRSDIMQAEKQLSLPQETDRYVTVLCGPDRIAVESLSKTFSDADDGEALSYVGSAGFVEIAVRNASARNRLHITTGDEISAFLSSNPHLPSLPGG